MVCEDVEAPGGIGAALTTGTGPEPRQNLTGSASTLAVGPSAARAAALPQTAWTASARDATAKASVALGPEPAPWRGLRRMARRRARRQRRTVARGFSLKTRNTLSLLVM